MKSAKGRIRNDAYIVVLTHPSRFCESGILFASACQFSGAFVKVDVVVAVVAGTCLGVYWLAMIRGLIIQ